MMDADTDIRVDMVGVADQYGVQFDHYGSGEENITVEVIGSPDSTLVGAGPEGVLNNGNKTVKLYTQEAEELTDAPMNNNDSSASQEVSTSENNAVKEPRTQNGRAKGKNEKPATTKYNVVKSVKNISNKEVKATSNGTLPHSARMKQPLVKDKSFNERQASNSNPSKTAKPVSDINPSKTAKPVSATSNPQKAKAPKSEVMSGSDNLVQSEIVTDRPKLKPLRKAAAFITEGNGDYIESPTSADNAKPRRVGKLPSYGFNFRCHERAEKRKEFYTKLEEKVHAQEVEKSNLQAKSKENQEAEIKMFRKSLNFKATPMPNFYQEPAPAKELKKIPTTRPRSPKLGRKKNPSSVDAEGKHEQNHHPGRLSLDEKAVLQSNSCKGSFPAQPRRPQRKSLPRLPSEKTRLSKNAPVQNDMINGSPPIARVEEEDNPESAPIAHVEEEFLPPNLSTPIARADEEVLTSILEEAHSGIENGSTVENLAQLSIQQEVVEH